MIDPCQKYLASDFDLHHSLFVAAVMRVFTHHLMIFVPMRGGIANAMRASGHFITDTNQGEGNNSSFIFFHCKLSKPQ